jgi:hypothetical protein
MLANEALVIGEVTSAGKCSAGGWRLEPPTSVGITEDGTELAAKSLSPSEVNTMVGTAGQF